MRVNNPYLHCDLTVRHFVLLLLRLGHSSLRRGMDLCSLQAANNIEATKPVSHNHKNIFKKREILRPQ